MLVNLLEKKRKFHLGYFPHWVLLKNNVSLKKTARLLHRGHFLTMETDNLSQSVRNSSREFAYFDDSFIFSLTDYLLNLTLKENFSWLQLLKERSLDCSSTPVSQRITQSSTRRRLWWDFECVASVWWHSDSITH